jgi:hypothetical protein
MIQLKAKRFNNIKKEDAIITLQYIYKYTVFNHFSSFLEEAEFLLYLLPILHIY